jgi:hypothetical protein
MRRKGKTRATDCAFTVAEQGKLDVSQEGAMVIPLAASRTAAGAFLPFYSVGQALFTCTIWRMSIYALAD